MNLVWKSNRCFVLDKAHLIYCNFSGAKTKYNDEGKRNFKVVIDDPDIANELENADIRLKVHEIGPDGEPLKWLIKVNVNFDSDYPPKIKSITSKKIVTLNKNDVKDLDKREIVNHAKMEINLWPYDDRELGRRMNSLWLNAMKAYLNEDWFDDDDDDEVYQPVLTGMPDPAFPDEDDIPF